MASEDWASASAVQAILANMLEDPAGDFQQAVRDLVPDGLRDAQAFSLWRLSGRVQLRAGIYANSTMGDGGVALHFSHGAQALCAGVGPCSSVVWGPTGAAPLGSRGALAQAPPAPLSLDV